MVPLAYATRHPGHPGKLILVSFVAAGRSRRERRGALLERLGGPKVGAPAIPLTARHAFRAIYDFREHIAVGGLTSYGDSLTNSMRKVVGYTGRNS